MRTSPQSLTELPPSPEEEQRARIIRYSLMMGIRTICVVACIFTPGWWVLIPALGAVFLPYLAVVVANAARRGRGGVVLRPGGLVRRGPG